MLNHLDGENTSSRLDRSTCLVPVSSKDLAALGRGSYKSSLLRGTNTLSTNITKDITPAVLQAAWALTLQCFIVADVLCFGYNGNTTGASHASDNDVPDIFEAQYILKVDRNESVRDFVSRLTNHQVVSDTRKGPSGFEIGVAEAGSSYHRCNTAIYFRTGVWLDRTSTTATTSLQEMDLRLVVTITPEDEIVIEVDYRLSHIHSEIAASTLSTFQHILDQVLNADTLLIRNLDLCPITDLEGIRSLTANVDPGQKRCLHDLIVEQCRKHPNNLAIRSWDGDMTYGELDDLSQRLALHLVRLGVRPETFVLSCFEKSTWAIVARLAILRAGGAYISIHASNPPVYLQSVINRTKTTILVTDSTFVNHY